MAHLHDRKCAFGYAQELVPSAISAHNGQALNEPESYRGGPDPHIDTARLVSCKSDLCVEKVQEDFSVTYAKTVSDPTVPSTGCSQRICNTHPALFVVVEGEERASVKIITLSWDHSAERSNEELRRVGRESQTVIPKL